MKVVVTGGAGLHRRQPLPRAAGRRRRRGRRARRPVHREPRQPRRARRRPGRGHRSSIATRSTPPSPAPGPSCTWPRGRRCPGRITDPMASHLANATGTVEVLEAARRAGGPQVVVASSSSVYGANPTLPKHEDLASRPLSPYAASKLATEAYALAWHHSYGLPVLAFRFFNVFGPLQPPGHAYAAVVPGVRVGRAGRRAAAASTATGARAGTSPTSARSPRCSPRRCSTASAIPSRSTSPTAAASTCSS